MTVFRTCKNCALEKTTCARREAVKAGLVGLGVTSVKIACKERKPVFVPGQRVLSTWTVPTGDWESANEENWPATVIKEIGAKFQLKIDDTLSDGETLASEYFKNTSLYVKARVGKIAPLNEPSRMVCTTCGRVGNGQPGEGGCYAHPPEGFAPGWTPYGCMAAEDQIKRAKTVGDLIAVVEQQLGDGVG